MTTKTRLSLALATGLLLLAGCAKDTETVPSAPSKLTLLADGGPWAITAYTRTTGSNAAVDRRPAIACERDDRFVFGRNGVLTGTEGPLVCRSGDTPTTVTSTQPWSFNSAQTQLTIGNASTGIPYEVVLLDANGLKLRWSRTSGGQTVVDYLEYRN